MNNFRKFKTTPKKQLSTVDGFVASPGFSAGGAQAPRAKINSNTNASSGSFQSTDGFYPRERRPQLGFPASKPAGRQPKRDDVGDIKLGEAKSKANRKHRSRTSQRSWARIAMKTSAIVMVSGVLVGGYLFGKGYLKARQIFKGGSAGAAALYADADPTKLNGEGDGRVNILMLGRGGSDHDGPDLTDTILVASIDPVHKEASILSIPRDLWVRSNGGFTKINSVFANAKYAELNRQGNSGDAEQRAEEKGVQAIEQVVEDSMGIPVHYYIMIDFEGFKRAIDTVGGVEVDVTEATSVYEPMHIDGRRYVLDVKPGRQKFDGFRALAYARSRYTSTRGDFDRAERQRQILIAMKDRIFSLGTFGNPLKISQLISDFGDNMRSNLGTGEVMRLYEIGQSIDSSKIDSLGLADPPNNYVTTSNINGLSVVVPRAGVGDFSEIHNFVRNTLKDGFIRKESADIAVYNGTNITGLAGRTATMLRSYGYNITVVADAPRQDYSDTVLVDLTNGAKRYTKTYLEKRLGVGAVTSMPSGSVIDPGEADFVIIWGARQGNDW